MNVQQQRAAATVALTAAALFVGVLARVPWPGEVPAPCAQPARVGAVVVCDGRGAPLGAAAWLFNGKLDLNTADADSLARIRGIGPALANRIVSAREERGGFRSVSDLDDVDGIGPKLLERIAAEVDVLAAAPSLRTPESATTSTTR